MFGIPPKQLIYQNPFIQCKSSGDLAEEMAASGSRTAEDLKQYTARPGLFQKGAGFLFFASFLLFIFLFFSFSLSLFFFFLKVKERLITLSTFSPHFNSCSVPKGNVEIWEHWICFFVIYSQTLPLFIPTVNFKKFRYIQIIYKKNWC